VGQPAARAELRSQRDPKPERAATVMAEVSVVRILAAIALGAACLPSCDDDPSFFCENGTCWCGPDDPCSVSCVAPPCHLQCAGDNPSCVGECANGDCECGEQAACAFACHSPPCHVRCDSLSDCSGECANGTCTCERGAACAFECRSGPCHVQCAGDNPQCDGECANGNCACGSGSSCHFSCTDRNCSASCAAGAQCALTCPGGRPGQQGCSFTTCAAGPPTICPDGVTTTCGMPCPQS
jgi:hypothetical protein